MLHNRSPLLQELVEILKPYKYIQAHPYGGRLDNSRKCPFSFTNQRHAEPIPNALCIFPSMQNAEKQTSN